VAGRGKAQARAEDGGFPAGATPDRGLADLVGHLPTVQVMRQQLASGTLTNSYWVSGPPQVGKTTLALAVAAEFLDAGGWPGGLSSHPDLWLEDGSATLPVDRIRRGDPDADPELGPTLQHFLSLSSFAGRGKVAVIGNADRLSLPAANSLLRILEEPAPSTMVWLCTARPDSEALPNTLRSRCQQLLLGPVETELIENWMVSAKGVAPEIARVSAAICLGRPGLGLEMTAEPELARRTEERLQALLDCADSGPAGWLELSRELAERGTDKELATGALRVWASFLRDCCCLAVGAPQLTRWPAQRAAAALWAEQLGLAGCSRRYDLALDALSRIAEKATPRLVLDRFLLLTFGGEPPGPTSGEPQAFLSGSDRR
jgi:DNA polymerase-3 subunit delta'